MAELLIASEWFGEGKPITIYHLFGLAALIGLIIFWMWYRKRQL